MKAEVEARKAKGFFALNAKVDSLAELASDLNNRIEQVRSKIGNVSPDEKNDKEWSEYTTARQALLAAAEKAIQDPRDLQDIRRRIPSTKKELLLGSSVSVTLGANNELAVTRERSLLGDRLSTLSDVGERLKKAEAADPQHQLELALDTGEDESARERLNGKTGQDLVSRRKERVAALEEYVKLLGPLVNKMRHTSGLGEETGQYDQIHRKLSEQLEISRRETQLEREKGVAARAIFYRDPSREDDLRKKYETPKAFRDEHVLLPRFVATEQAPPEPSKGGGDETPPESAAKGGQPEQPKRAPAPKPEAAPGPHPKKDGAPERAAKDAEQPKEAPEGLFASVSAAASAAVSSVSEAGNAAADAAAAALGRAAETARILVAPTEEDLLRRDVAGHPEILAVLDRTRTEGADKNRILDEARAMAKAQGVAVEPYWRGEVALAPWVGQAEARSAEERLRAPPRIIASTAVAARVLVIGEYRGKPTARGLVAAHGAVATVGARQEKTFWNRLGAELARAYAPMVVAPLAAVFVAEDAERRCNVRRLARDRHYRARGEEKTLNVLLSDELVADGARTTAILAEWGGDAHFPRRLVVMVGPGGATPHAVAFLITIESPTDRPVCYYANTGLGAKECGPLRIQTTYRWNGAKIIPLIEYARRTVLDEDDYEEYVEFLKTAPGSGFKETCVRWDAAVKDRTLTLAQYGASEGTIVSFPQRGGTCTYNCILWLVGGVLMKQDAAVEAEKAMKVRGMRHLAAFRPADLRDLARRDYRDHRRRTREPRRRGDRDRVYSRVLAHGAARARRRQRLLGARRERDRRDRGRRERRRAVERRRDADRDGGRARDRREPAPRVVHARRRDLDGARVKRRADVRRAAEPRRRRARRERHEGARDTAKRRRLRDALEAEIGNNVGRGRNRGLDDHGTRRGHTDRAVHAQLTDAEWEIDSGAHERRISESADRAEEPACADPNSDRGNQTPKLPETSKKHKNTKSQIG